MGKLGGILSGPTPRKEWKFQDKMMAIALGTTWPPVALLMCVGIVYSCIQPVITIFGLSTFSLLYVMYKVSSPAVATTEGCLADCVAAFSTSSSGSPTSPTRSRPAASSCARAS